MYTNKNDVIRWATDNCLPAIRSTASLAAALPKATHHRYDTAHLGTWAIAL